MYLLQQDLQSVDELEPTTFSDLGMKESDIEEILRSNINILCRDEESLLILGQQVRDEKLGRSDLTAVDNDGNVVLIEIKRDMRDIVGRREPFEMQAVRYAASYATLRSVDEMVKVVYAPYIEKNRREFELGVLTSYETGIRKLSEFLQDNDAEDAFNARQRVILVSSEFNDQTLSTVSWLNSNGVDISCFQLTPYRISGSVLLDVEKILPLAESSDYYVSLFESGRPGRPPRGLTKRRNLPRIDAMLEWGVVEPGDTIIAKNRGDRATLLANGNVSVDGEEMAMHKWLAGVFGWSSIETYAFSVHEPTGKSLSEIRQEYMERQEEDDLDL